MAFHPVSFQTLISYLPHFLSWIIVTGILHDMLSGTGIVNEVLVNLHGQIDNGIPSCLLPDICKCYDRPEIPGMGKEIDRLADHPSLYEAAAIDGAGRWNKIKYVTLPGIKPTIVILLLMNVGNVPDNISCRIPVTMIQERKCGR